MKAIITVKEKEIDWFRSLFRSCHPLLMQICKKPFLEYLVDFSILCGCSEIRLVTDIPVQRVEDLYGDGSRWGIQLSYSSIRETDGFDEVLEKNSGFCRNTTLLVFEGFFFLHYDKNLDYSDFFRSLPGGELKRCSTGRLSIVGGSPENRSRPTAESPLLETTPLSSVADIHQLSIEILTRNPERYVLPGYSSENQAFIGQNVVIARKAEINPPVMIGNHVQIHKDAVIGPGAIIGSDVIIDSNCQIVNSVVFDKTYIGKHLDLKGKVVGENSVVNPIDGIQLHLEDEHLLSQVRPASPRVPFLHRLVTRIHALLAMILLLLPFLCCVSILKMQKRWMPQKQSVLINSQGKTRKLSRPRIAPTGYIGKFALLLSLDRFPLLSAVLGGKLSMIGSKILEDTGENREKIKEYSSYRPAVFSYAEAETWPDENSEWEIVERFHLARKSIFHDQILLIKAIVNRIYTEDNP